MGDCAVKGWSITGDRGDAYAAEVCAETHEGKAVVRMWRTDEGADGFGAMCQLFRPDVYRGRRVQLSASLRTIEVSGRAGLCLRIDGREPDGSRRHLGFDNMGARPRVAGTTAWARYACVLDVPEEASAVFISNVLSGRGELLWSDLRFEVVDDSVPVTDMLPPAPLRWAPTNLDFSDG